MVSADLSEADKERVAQEKKRVDTAVQKCEEVIASSSAEILKLQEDELDIEHSRLPFQLSIEECAEKIKEINEEIERQKALREETLVLIK